MRIISGNLKSVRFSPPKGFPSRPTTDFAKEALFNVLTHRYALVELEILDLCAGTGNISFEFASREAGYITAVEANYKCTSFIQSMAKKYEVDEFITVIRSDVPAFLEKVNATYDIIFADPPFEVPIHGQIVNLVFERELLNENGCLIIEHSKHLDLSNEPNFVELKKYGGVCFSFFYKNV